MSTAANFASIESIVVLMLENRSLDNLLGFLYADSGNRSPSGDAFDGLTGQETNPDPAGGDVRVTREKHDLLVPHPDPGEEFEHINMQLFSSPTAPTPPMAKNDGFVRDYAAVLEAGGSSGSCDGVMHCYDPSVIPCLAEIARRHAVSDRWFASVPSQTWPNRAFVHAASSNGHVNNAPNNPLQWRIDTIFNRMAAKGRSWRVYFDELFVSLTRLQLPHLWPPGYSKNFLDFEDFLHDANAGTLPNYAFVEPNFFPNPVTGEKPNDQHPPHDVAVGDAFIGRVYNAIVTGPQWKANKVLLVITYDEHGGCFDHCPPPTDAVPPSAGPGDENFDFRRLGVRVPCVVASPFVKPGSVFRAPAGRPALDHTAILATVEHRFGLAALSERDAKASDLAFLLTEAPGAAAQPLAIPQKSLAKMKAAPGGHAALAAAPLNDLQRSIVEAMEHADLEALPAHKKGMVFAHPAPANASEAYEYIRAARARTGI